MIFKILLIASNLFASSWTMYGTGAQNKSMANSTVALPTDGFSLTYNPSLMSETKKGAFSFGFEGAISKFDTISQVLTDTPNLGGSSNTVSDVNPNVPDLFIAAIGVQTPLSRSAERPVSLGINVYAPVEKVFGLDSQDAFLPQYSMYRSDAQRLGVVVALSKKVSDVFSLGVGLDQYLVQSATARIRLPAGGNSTTRLKIDAKAGMAPIVGLTARPLDELRISAVWRGKKDYRTEMDVNNTINILSSPSPLYLSVSGSLFYDPEMYSLGASWVQEKNKFSLAGRYDKWTGYSGSVMTISFQNFRESLSQNLPATPFKDVFNIFAGYERNFEILQLRLGYGYMPSPVPDQSGESNFLDSDRHVIALGIGSKFEPEWLGTNLSVDGCVFVHNLVTKKVTKASSSYIGAPGYTIAGNMYGYGLTLTSEF